MTGPEEIEVVSLSFWRWQISEVHVPLAAYPYGVDAIHLGTRLHWFTKTVSFELRGARVQIARFLEREGRSWRRILKIPPKLKKLIS